MTTPADARRKLMDYYINRLNGGDTAKWDPGKEPEVVALRDALHATARSKLIALSR